MEFYKLNAQLAIVKVIELLILLQKHAFVMFHILTMVILYVNLVIILGFFILNK